MTDSPTQPDNAGNRPGTAQDDAIDRLGLILPDTPLDVVARGVAAVAEALGKPGATTTLVIRLADCEAQLDSARQQRDDARERLGAVERNAELLVVARHDLMVAVDQTTARLNSYADPAGLPQERDAHEAAQLLDRLAAYMKGQDDRIVAVADQRDRAREARDYVLRLIDESRPSVRLVNDWATWSDASLYAYADAILRKVLPHAPARDAIVDALAEIRRVARDRLGDDGFTIPPAYGDVEREAASTALRRIASRGDVANPNSYAGTSTDGERYGDTVDTIARTLGMRRAGA